MKQILHIEADFDKPELLKNMVEELVTRKNTGKSNTLIGPSGYHAIETASAEAYVCGSISLREKKSSLRLHFESSFFFTCLKTRGAQYELTWSISLS